IDLIKCMRHSHGMLELRDLRLLQAIDKHGSLTRASRALGLSQSALSRQLLTLEDSLGVLLFTRQHRALFPTQAGRELTASATPLLAEVESVGRGARENAAVRPPRRIATECYTCYRWLPSVLRQAGVEKLAIDVDSTRNPADAL